MLTKKREKILEILVILEILGYFGQLRGFRVFSFDILWFWGHFGNFGVYWSF